MEHDKLYSPLNFFLRSKTSDFEGVYDDIHYWRDAITHEEAFAYMTEINEQLAGDRKRYDNGRGLAEYYGGLDDKVESLVPHVELHGDKLWMVADVRLNEPLSDVEMADLKSWWGGQLSDGWGEGLEQKEIVVDEGALYIEPWTSSAGFFIATQSEFDRRIGIEQPNAEEIAEGADETLLRIAKKHCGIESLETRNSDSLDFYDVSVWGLKAALEEAFEAGVAHQLAKEHVVEMINIVSIASKEELRDTLMTRLDQDLSENLDAYREAVLNPSITNDQLIDSAQKIAALIAAHTFLRHEYDLSDDEISTLMKLSYPLDSVAADWAGISAYIETDEGVRDFLSDPEYIIDRPLIESATREKACIQSGDKSTAPVSEKSSLLASIREAKAAEQHKDKPAINKPEPEI